MCRLKGKPYFFQGHRFHLHAKFEHERGTIRQHIHTLRRCRCRRPIPRRTQHLRTWRGMVWRAADVRKEHTDLGSSTVRQSSAQQRKNASGSVSCKCSTSSNGASSSPSLSSPSSAARPCVAVASEASGPLGEGEGAGFQVAADGMFAFVSSTETILPSANAASASAAA